MNVQKSQTDSLEVVILDSDLQRMNLCEKSALKALKEANLKGVVTKVCEPPYLARMDVMGRLPALEIDGMIWSRPSKEAFGVSELVKLLKKHYCN